ncbi:MAG: RHS repeat-associated core domain-containing protein [Acidobacteriaceae bacterium]
MQAQTSIRMPDSSMMPPLVCLLSTASGHPSIFTGKERDAESGNDDFGARYYASTMGRWMSPDWSTTPTAVPFADLTNPQTLNLYQYEGNNPLAKADKDGHCYPVCTILAGAAIGAGAGALAEYAGEKLRGEKVDSTKIWHAAAGGAVAGAITGLAGPEAGIGSKIAASVLGQVTGGEAERGLNGKRLSIPKQWQRMLWQALPEPRSSLLLKRPLPPQRSTPLSRWLWKLPPIRLAEAHLMGRGDRKKLSQHSKRNKPNP